MIDRKQRYEHEVQSLRRYEPSAGHDLLGMELDFVAYLSGIAELDASTLAVERTGIADCQLVVRARTAPQASLEDVGHALTQVWLGKLGYVYSEAHYLEITDESAVLHFVTQIGPGGFYVTGSVTVAGNGG